MGDKATEMKRKGHGGPKTAFVSCQQLGRTAHVVWYPKTSDKGLEFSILAALEISPMEDNISFGELKEPGVPIRDERNIVHLAINEHLPDGVQVEVFLPGVISMRTLGHAADDSRAQRSSLLDDASSALSGPDENQPLLTKSHDDDDSNDSQDGEVAARAKFRRQLLKVNRINAHLANERTWLAWARTAMSLLSIAFSLDTESIDASAFNWRVSWFTFGCLLIVVADVNWFLGWGRYVKVKHICSLEDVSAAEHLMAEQSAGFNSLRNVTMASGLILVGVTLVYWWYGYEQMYS